MLQIWTTQLFHQVTYTQRESVFMSIVIKDIFVGLQLSKKFALFFVFSRTGVPSTVSTIVQ